MKCNKFNLHYKMMSCSLNLLVNLTACSKIIYNPYVFLFKTVFKADKFVITLILVIEKWKHI